MPDTRTFANLEHLGSAANYAEDIHDLFELPSPLEGLYREECSILCEYMDCYGAPSHTTLIEEGENGNHLIIVLTGTLDVTKRTNDNVPRVVARVGSGDFLGEMSFVDGSKRSATCTTREPTDFAVLTHDALNEILIDHPRLGNKFLLMLLQQIVVRLRETTNGIVLPTTRSLV